MDPKWIVTLQGKEHPLYAGVLAEAHERGLQSIETQLIQQGDDKNNNTWIVKATVRTKDGQTFEGYGDANPRNTNPRIATALLRMAETRAKGRALRDAINCGQTMLEELPDLEGISEGNRAPSTQNPAPSPNGVATARVACAEAGCGVMIERARASRTERLYGAPLCADCEAHREAPSAEPRAPSKEDSGSALTCSMPGCGKAITKGQEAVSKKKFGEPFCPSCQATFNQKEKAA